MAYGTVAGIESLIGDSVPGRVYSNTTVPSLDTVTTILDAVDAEINLELKQQGYVTPVDVTNTDVIKHLAYANSCGAAARILSTMPMQSYTQVDEGDSGGDRRSMLDRELWHCIQRIRRFELVAERTQSNTGKLQVFTQKNGARTRKPTFTRDKFDYQGPV